MISFLTNEKYIMDYYDKNNLIEIIDREGEYRNTLAVSDFSRVFDSMVTCYKLYWLEAIIELLLKNDRMMFSLTEIIDVMISNAWYTVREYHLKMGTVYGSTTRKNRIEEAVNDLAVISGLENNATQEQILEKLRVFRSNEKLIKDKEMLMTEVPFHFLSPFFDSDRRKELRKWHFDRSVKEINKRNSELELPYHFVQDLRGNTCIEMSPNWCQFFVDGNTAILGWIKYEKIQYLQKRNSTVGGIIYKLAPYKENKRELQKVRKLWNTVVECTPVLDIYTDQEIVLGKYDVDHFIPWSYISNNELWNLIPADHIINIQKSNCLPEWNRYFRNFGHNQYLLSRQIYQNEITHRLFYDCMEENLQSYWGKEQLYVQGIREPDFLMVLEKNLRTHYEAAKRQGFEIWTKS